MYSILAKGQYERKERHPTKPTKYMYRRTPHKNIQYRINGVSGGGGVLRFPETSQNWAGARARASS